jgi:hypothetical protein
MRLALRGDDARFRPMAKDDRPTNQIDYEDLQQAALRGVVRAALDVAASPGGLPGEHHLYISFRTSAAGVSLPADLRARFPDDMTIVLQNQYWDLNPGESAFSVTLQFNGQPKSLSIPYAAVTRFYDPSVQFLLHFTPTTTVAAAEPEVSQGIEDPDQPKIVSLDRFRKK